MIATDPIVITDVRELLGNILRPRPRISPSAWAEDNRHLKEGTTPAPGRWRNDYLPWLQPILDAFYLESWAEGIVVKKPAQAAGTEILVTLIGYLFATAPGPTLFVATTQDIFNIQGVYDIYREAHRAYTALGAPEALQLI